MKLIFVCVTMLAFSASAKAWDCTEWTNNIPGHECYKPPTTAGSSANAAATASADPRQSQHQNATADASNQGNNISANTYVPQNIAPTILPSMIISGCGIGATAGGGTPKGNGALGFEFTTAECYTLQMAYADYAMGDYQTGCELLHSNKTHQNAAKRGAKIADCALLVQREKIVYRDVPVGPSEAEIQERINRAVVVALSEQKPCMLEKQHSKSVKLHKRKSNASLTCKKWEWVN